MHGLSLPADPSFGSYDTALAHLTGELLPVDTDIYWEQGVLDVLFHYPIDSATSRFSINPGLERLGIRVVNILRFVHPDGVVREFDFPGNPGTVPLDPSWGQVAFRFIELGFFHILEGTDHLLFLLCLVIPFRQFRSLVVIVTSFTVAHSITLIASAFGYAPDALWFPPLVETLIAISILYMAFENIIGANLRQRWIITFGFGLIHGFGFSFLLRETLQFAGSHLTTSLFAFNVGVELGQILVLVITIPLLNAFFRMGVTEKVGTIYLSGARHPLRVALDGGAGGAIPAVLVADVRRGAPCELDAPCDARRAVRRARLANVRVEAAVRARAEMTKRLRARTSS